MRLFGRLSRLLLVQYLIKFGNEFGKYFVVLRSRDQVHEFSEPFIHRSVQYPHSRAGTRLRGLGRAV